MMKKIPNVTTITRERELFFILYPYIYYETGDKALNSLNAKDKKCHHQPGDTTGDTDGYTAIASEVTEIVKPILASIDGQEDKDYR
jgi:hypothetical protein